MSSANNRINSQKRGPAILAALAMTSIIGLAILALGANALLNRNVVPVQAASLPDQSISVDQASVDQATIDQLQNLVEQYQARELQYQTELQQAADQLDQTGAELQQYQGVVSALQDAGVIQITQDGRIFLSRAASGGGEHESGDDD